MQSAGSVAWPPGFKFWDAYKVVSAAGSLQTEEALPPGDAPADIARAMHFMLASPAITGEILHLDGGNHLIKEPPC